MLPSAPRNAAPSLRPAPKAKLHSSKESAGHAARSQRNLSFAPSSVSLRTRIVRAAWASLEAQEIAGTAALPSLNQKPRSLIMMNFIRAT
ncbi:hypothetical protein ONZ45_g3366 [Pleurotus djamor]|nr:hypothetical protein ONZ45_g3366 [Pleurotus djamor]